jgi:hypothetical protein
MNVSCRAHSAELVTVDSQGESDVIEAEVNKLRGRNIYIHLFYTISVNLSINLAQFAVYKSKVSLFLSGGKNSQTLSPTSSYDRKKPS